MQWFESLDSLQWDTSFIQAGATFQQLQALGKKQLEITKKSNRKS